VADLLSVRDGDYSYVHSGVTGEEMLFRFPSDRYEQKNLAGELPDVTARYRKLADDFRKRMVKRAADTDDADIDQSTRDKLKALGYAE
jgi:hypothetical protein